MLKLEHLQVIFHPETLDEKIALKDVSLEVEQDDFICIIGGNGAGKSTLLNAISGAISVDAGTIVLDDKKLNSIPEHERAKMIGRLFQDPLRGTAAHMTILENLSLAYGRGKRRLFQKAIDEQDKQYFRERLKRLQLGLEDRLDSEVGLLSGGQRQALTLLMATLKPPKLLLLDEHTAALDPKTTEIIMEETNRLVHEYHIPAIMITHNLKQAMQYGNRLIVMQEGEIIKDMKASEKAQMTVEKLLSMYELI